MDDSKTFDFHHILRNDRLFTVSSFSDRMILYGSTI